MNIEMQKFYENIKNKIGSKEYRLGLDLGVGSIGWAILSLKKENNELIPDEIVLSGSRIFTPSTGGKERREKRLQRNAHRHKRERLFRLWKCLSSYGLALPAPEKLEKENPLDGDTSRKRFNLEVLRRDPYVLRYKALDEKIGLQELGYVIYHLANHRGTASLRTFEDFDEEKKNEMKQMQAKADNTFKLLKEKKYRTYGELIYKEKLENTPLQNRPKLRNRDGKADFIVTRDLVLQEYDEILKKQKEFYPDTLKDDVIGEIKQILNFEYDKLIPEPGHCPYFPNEQKLPKSHPLSEERRLWEALNNVRVNEPILNGEEVTGFRERKLTQEEKDKLFAELKKTKEITESKAIKILNLPQHTEMILQGRDKKTQKLKGYRNIDLEKMSFWSRLSHDKKNSFFYDWISCPDDFQLKKLLKEKYGLNDEEIENAIKEVELISGYAPIGETATKILIEYIKKGLSFTEAIDKAVEDGKLSIKQLKVYDTLPYYGEVLSDATQPVICKALSEKFKDKNYKKPNTNPDEEKWGRIPNPVVHQTLNELKKLVNEIIEATGKKPLEISIEVSRDLKKSSEERDKISREQSQNETQRQRIYETYCKGRNVPGNAILKFTLFEEQEKKCPYCGETITPDDIYNSRVDIDHIFPISESLDNSRNNLVLAHNACNETKGQKCPYDAFAGTDRWNSILSYLESTEGMKNKKWRFMEGAYQEFLKNIPILKRFETDTSYISKIAARYLSCLFDKKSKVICYKGGLTAQLRLAWDMNSLLIPHIKELLYEKEIKEFDEISSLNIKLRNDHRHHALDAIALAYATRSYSNRLNTLSAKGYDIDFTRRNWLSKILPPPNNMSLEDFSKILKEKVKEIVVSIKHDHNPNGELLKGTAYGVYLINGKYFLVSRKKVSEFNDIKEAEKKLIKGCEEIKESKNQKLVKMLEHNKRVLEKIKNNITIAETKIKEEDAKLKDEGKKTYPITEKRIMKKALELTNDTYYDFQNKEQEKFFILRKPDNNSRGCGYDTGDNLCLDLYHDKNGKLCGEIIRKVDAMRKKEPKYKEQGFSLLERIYQGDILECIVSSDKKALSAKTANTTSDKVLVKVTTFTELPTYYKGKLDQIQIHFININRTPNKPDDSFYISSMKKYKPRKVILTPMGAMKYRSKIIGDKNMEDN